MKNSLHTILGVDTSDIPEDAALELEWHNLPSSWGVFVLLGMVGLLALLVY